MLTKERARRWLERHFFLRIHMSLILIATFSAGLAATKGLLLLGIDSLLLRYGLAVIAAYLVFLLLIRIWIMYVRSGGIEFDGSGVDSFFDVAASGSSGDVDVPIGGGGHFGGGGASGSWGDPTPIAKAASSGASKSGGGGFSFGGFDIDGEGLFVVIAFLLLVLGLFLVGIYLIYTAPVILTDAFFEAVLAGALVRRAKKVVSPTWVGTIWRATFWPFCGILALALILAWTVHHVCPSAKRMTDAFHCMKKN